MFHLSKERLLRLWGVLFLLAALAFAFSPMRWMAAAEGAMAVIMFVLSVRARQAR